MRAFQALCLLGLTLFVTRPAAAQTSVARSAESQASNPLFKHSFNIGLESAQWDYIETDDKGRQFMKDAGRLNGVRLGADHVTDSSVYLGGHTSFLTGKTHYDGQLWDGSPYKNVSKNMIFEAEARVGGSAQMGDSSALVPYTGLSFWQLNNPEVPEDDHDYSRQIRYLNLPLGLMARTTVGSSSMLTFDGTYYYFLGGEVKTQLTGVDPNMGLVTNKQSKGRGLKLGGTYHYLMAGSELTIGVYYRTLNIQSSNQQTFSTTDDAGKKVLVGISEPANSTKMVGLSIGLGF